MATYDGRRGGGAESTGPLAAQSAEEAQETLRQLRVREAELEAQNAALRQTLVDLDASRARYFDFYELAPVGYLSVGESGLIEQANLTTCTLLGVSRAAVVAQPISRFVFAEDAHIYHGLCEEVMASGASQSREVRVAKADGMPLCVQLAATAAFGEDGTPILLLVLSDITARKRIETALRDSEFRLTVATEGAGDGLWDWDVVAGTVFFSKGWKSMLGLADDEVGTGPDEWIKRVHPDDLAATMAVARPHLDGTAPSYSSEHRLACKDGSWKWVLDRGVVVNRDAAGKALRVIGTHSDITARKQAEAALEASVEENRIILLRNQQLGKSESLGRMAGGVAHHFNNQLHALMMSLETAMDELPRSSRAFEILTEAWQSARKAAEVGTLMLTYVGHAQAKREPLDLSEVCQRHLPELLPGLPKNVGLETELRARGPNVRGSATELQRALGSLFTNAAEASADAGGVVRLTVKAVFAADIPSANRFPADWHPAERPYACVEVADAGGGIPSEDIPSLFDPFFSTKFVGRGLGLPVALGIVRAHEGAITVESEPGRGSVFRIFLPVVSERAARKPVQVVTAAVAAQGATVLVVDDEAAVRKAVARSLERRGFVVLTAEGGADAVAMLRENRNEIACVVCDLSMPGMDGWQTLSALRELEPGVPAILASGYSEAEVMAGAHSEMPAAFLNKPYQTAALVNAIERAVADRKK